MFDVSLYEKNMFNVVSKFYELLQAENLISTKVEYDNYTKISHNISILGSGYEYKDRYKDESLKVGLIHPISLRLPMIVPPKLYGNNILGGYLLNDYYYTEPLIIKNFFLSKESTINEINILYTFVNNMGRVPFKINVNLLDFLLSDGYKFGLLKEIIKKPDNLKKNSLEYNKYISDTAEYITQAYTLNIAKLFKNLNSIYFPVRLDYRGRLYCNATYLNYQGSELAKSLLLFSEGTIISISDISALDYLKAYGANCYGNEISKKRFITKVRWVDFNEDHILNFTNGLLLNKAKSKYLFLAFCLEYIRIKKAYDSGNGDKINTYLPIQLDATCNGYQHLSMLSRDSKLAEQLNIFKPLKKAYPQDLYNLLAMRINNELLNLKKDIEYNTGLNLVKEKLEMKKKKGDDYDIEMVEKGADQLVKNNLDSLYSYERLIGFEIDRYFLKKSVMTESYNVSLFSSVDYLSKECNTYKVGKEIRYYLKDENNYLL